MQAFPYQGPNETTQNLVLSGSGLFAVEYALYGRVDSEKEFYALYFAFGAPFLLMPSVRQYIRLDEIILNCVGTVLFAAAIILSNFRRTRSLFNKQES